MFNFKAFVAAVLTVAFVIFFVGKQEVTYATPLSYTQCTTATEENVVEWCFDTYNITTLTPTYQNLRFALRVINVEEYGNFTHDLLKSTDTYIGEAIGHTEGTEASVGSLKLDIMTIESRSMSLGEITKDVLNTKMNGVTKAQRLLALAILERVVNTALYDHNVVKDVLDGGEKDMVELKNIQERNKNMLGYISEIISE